DHADGLLSNKQVLKYPQTPGRTRGCIAGLAVSNDGRTLWAANAFHHTLARFDTSGQVSDSGFAEIEMGKDTYPYGLVLDEDKGRLYVSLWGKAEVAV